ncbi:helix-turn-helix domain-containing protein [Halegenticoccus tardaugens]|uniref:helix-turn-helix domain-containing protein n=1 Tax=Halegenticoccus tardaugens TaxID=2071624 RepID=UPI00100B62D7|nr:helix-turn-helix domain-containing protein [Halegenticoccus tardaugens]
MTANNTDEPNDRQGTETEEIRQSRESSTRYATVLLELGDEGSDATDDSIAGSPAVTRERLYHFNPVDDGTVVMLSDLRGNLDRARTALASDPSVLNYDVVDRGDGEGFAYIHCELRDPVKSLVSTLHEYEIVLDTPIEFADGGTARATLIGEAIPLREALDAISGLVEVRLERTGAYHPDRRDLGSRLTDRQHQILSIAVDCGYYEVPRRATLEDIAAEAGLSRATVGEHLQKIEAAVLSRVAR